MAREKTSRLHDIKETASDAVEIMRQIGTPEVQESLDKIRETAISAKEIMEALKTPGMVANIENFRLISENMNEAAKKMENAVVLLKETGVIEEAKELISSVKGKVDSFGNGGANWQELRETNTAIKEMMESISALVDEVKITIVSSKKSGTIHSIKETTKEAADIYNAIRYKGPKK